MPRKNNRQVSFPPNQHHNNDSVRTDRKAEKQSVFYVASGIPEIPPRSNTPNKNP